MQSIGRSIKNRMISQGGVDSGQGNIEEQSKVSKKKEVVAMKVSLNDGCSRIWRYLEKNEIRHQYLMIIIFFILAVQIVFSVSVFAADTQELGKFQVVTGTNDTAFLVNTETGSVWILTYRTTGTGREAVAMPYKFIRVSPKSKGDFLVEEEPVTPTSSK